MKPCMIGLAVTFILVNAVGFSDTTSTRQISTSTTSPNSLTKAERLAKHNAEINQHLRAKQEARRRGLPDPMTSLTVVTGKGRMELPMDPKDAAQAHKLITEGKLKPEDLMPTSAEKSPDHQTSSSDHNETRLEREERHRRRVLRLMEEASSTP